jgi:hypothetical protein
VLSPKFKNILGLPKHREEQNSVKVTWLMMK